MEEPVQPPASHEPPSGYKDTNTNNYGELVHLLEQVAKKNSTKTKYILVMMYRENPEIQQDQDLSFYWMEQAAEQGFVPAQFELALMYQKKAKTEQDVQLAFEWMQKAAKQGHEAAKEFLNTFTFI